MDALLKHVAPIGEITYTSQSRQTLEIDRTGLLTGANIRVQFTVTNGGTAAVGPFFETLSRIINRLEIIVNGRDTILSLPGSMLAVLAHFSASVVPHGTDDTVVLTGSAATVYDVVIPIEFTLPRSVAPLGSGLPAFRLGQTTMALTWGNSDCSDIYGTPNSAAISAVTCWVEGEYILGLDPARAYAARVLDVDTETVDATTTNHQIVIDTGTGLLYRGLTLVTLRDKVAAANILQDTTTGVSLESGTLVFQGRSPTFIQAANKRNYNLDTVKTGVYHLNAEMFGDGRMWLNSDRSQMPSDLRLKLAVTKTSGTEEVHVIREAVRPFKQ
jgi:hypothetical protein